jgi:hypothetical protein
MASQKAPGEHSESESDTLGPEDYCGGQPLINPYSHHLIGTFSTTSTTTTTATTTGGKASSEATTERETSAEHRTLEEEVTEDDIEPRPKRMKLPPLLLKKDNWELVDPPDHKIWRQTVEGGFGAWAWCGPESPRTRNLPALLDPRSGYTAWKWGTIVGAPSGSR